MSKIVFDDNLDRRIEFARIKSNRQKEKEGRGLLFTESDFRHHLFMLGLMEYEFRILPEITGEPYKPYYSIQEENVIDQSGEVVA
jgi:hypothetical protein